MTVPNLPVLPPGKGQPPRRRNPKDHLSIRMGSFFEASAGGRIAVLLLALVAVVYLFTPVIARLAN
jgi:hypothetical protein